MEKIRLLRRWVDESQIQVLRNKNESYPVKQDWSSKNVSFLDVRLKNTKTGHV